MQISFILFLFFQLSVVLAQDCVNCPPRGSELPAVPVPEWPLSLIDVENVDLPRNSRATYCKRTPEMVSTIVIHHTAGFETRSPQDINRDHMNQGSASDPWLMAGYNYFVNSSSNGSPLVRSRVTEGRPLEIAGAHAGSDAWAPMTPVQRSLWARGAVTCGRPDLGFSQNPALVSGSRIKANIATIGVAVIGNYAPFSRRNLTGYSRSRPRYPSRQTLDMLGRLSCQLQRKYPNMKEIKWHSYYNRTECPGNIKNYINQIKTIARGYGCEFN